MKNYLLKFICLSILLITSSSLWGIGFTCESQQNGLWSEASTWINCNGTIPQTSDSVVLSSHIVEFDGDRTIAAIEGSGALNILAGDHTLTVTSVQTDLRSIGILLFGDFTLTNVNNDIRIGGFDGATGSEKITFNSNFVTWLSGDHFSVNGIGALNTSAGGATRISNSRTIIINGSENSTIDDQLAIGSSDNVTIDHRGTGQLKFSEKIFRSGGAPHRLTVNKDFGFAFYVGSIELGEFTTTGDAQSLFFSNVTTNTSGSNNGNITLNSPIILAADLSFSTTAGTGIGNIYINNSINDDEEFGTSSILTINNSNTTEINVVGDSSPIIGLVTDANGQTILKGDIETEDSMIFNGATSLTNDVELTSEIIKFESSIDNAGNDLTLSTSDVINDSYIKGNISGSGDFIKTGTSNVSLQSINDITGQLQLNQGKLTNDTISKSIFPSVSLFNITYGTEARLGDSTNNRFTLQDGQTLKGSGLVSSDVESASNANVVIAPESSPFKLTMNQLLIDEDTIVEIDINGTTVGMEYDQIKVTDIVELEWQLNNRASLEVIVGEIYSPTVGDEFIILDNTGMYGIGDTFSELSEGAKFLADDLIFTISYTAGDGNDIALTVSGIKTTYFIDHEAADGGDGLSWATAFNDLHDGLNTAIFGDEIWVADGVYIPSVTADPSDSFILKDGVKLYGGFNGSETELEQRDPSANLTIISGDVGDNDTNKVNGITPSYSDLVGANTYHLITSLNSGEDTLIDGFTLTGGSASGLVTDDQRGSVVFGNNSTLKFNDIIVQGNHSTDKAALYRCESEVTNASFINNSSGDIAAISISSGIYTDVVFEGNVAVNEGALFSLGGGSFDLVRVKMIGNGDGNSSLIYAYDIEINFNDILASGNDVKKGVIEFIGDTYGVINNLTMTSNSNLNASADVNAGINLSIDSGNPPLEINNSILWNNLDDTGQGTLDASIINTGPGTVEISSSIIQGSGGSTSWTPTSLTDGGNNLDINPMFISVVDPINAPTNSGNYHLDVGSPAIAAGNDSLVVSTTDLDGNTRIVNTVEMGAYEFASFSLSVDVTGLDGTLVLQNNGGDDLTIIDNGIESFSQDVALTGSYNITVLTQPTSPNQECVATNGVGVNVSSNATIDVSCTTTQYKVGVDVSGLDSGGPFSIMNNSETTNVFINGIRYFSTELDDGSAYNVSITSQPSSPNQICSITSGNETGNLNGMDEIISVECITVQYNLGVDVSGLANGVTLGLLNNSESLDVTNNGITNFPTALDDGSSYLVSITAQPTSPNQECIITSGDNFGLIGGKDEIVTIECTTLQYNVGVDVSGLASGNSVELDNNGESLVVNADGLSNFATALDDRSAYAVSITTQPSNPNQICSITSGNASGNLAGSDEVLTVECTTVQYNVGVDVSGLATGNSVEFDNNGENLSVISDGSVNFATALDDGSNYDVVVTSQPTTPNQMCSVVSGSGELDGDDVLITVTCTTNQYLVGGMASGLANGNSVTLSLGAEDLDVDSNNAFVFLNPLTDESNYSVTVSSQPTVPNQTCDLVNPSGSIAGDDVDDIEVNCITNQYSIGGTVTGLHSGNNLVIQNNNADNLMIANSGDFDFNSTIEDLQSYSVSILEQPTSPIQPCIVSQNSGNVSGNNVTSVLIVCGFGDDLIYKNGFE